MMTLDVFAEPISEANPFCDYLNRKKPPKVSVRLWHGTIHCGAVVLVTHLGDDVHGSISSSGLSSGAVAGSGGCVVTEVVLHLGIKLLSSLGLWSASTT